MKYPIGSLVLSIAGEMDSEDGNTDRETGPNAWGHIVDYSPRMQHYGVEFTNGTSVFIEEGELDNREAYDVTTPEVMAGRLKEIRELDESLNEGQCAPDGASYESVLLILGV